MRSLGVLCCGPLQIQLEELGEKFVVGQGRRPAVGGEDGGVELAVDVVEPRRALVVEIGEGAFFEFFGAGLIAGDEAGVFDGADANRVDDIVREGDAPAEPLGGGDVLCDSARQEPRPPGTYGSARQE